MNLLKRAAKEAIVHAGEETEMKGRSLTFRLDPGFAGFAGHFPDYPILPAFVQVLMSIIVVEEYRRVALEFVSLDNAKFQKEIRPGELITVACEDTEGEAGIRVRVRISIGAAQAAVFTVTCRRARTE